MNSSCHYICYHGLIWRNGNTNFIIKSITNQLTVSTCQFNALTKHNLMEGNWTGFSLCMWICDHLYLYWPYFFLKLIIIGQVLAKWRTNYIAISSEDDDRATTSRRATFCRLLANYPMYLTFGCGFVVKM